MNKDKSQYFRFINKVKFPDDNEENCWIWTGAKIWSGYGMMRDRNGKKQLAHRISFQMFCHGIPKGLCVLHCCDNRICVNPNHLFLGTRSDNMKDMWNKDRHPIINMGRPSESMIGENNIRAKLFEQDVIKIRDLYQKGLSQKELAKLFDIQIPAIWKIVHGHTWKHLSYDV